MKKRKRNPIPQGPSRPGMAHRAGCRCRVCVLADRLWSLDADDHGDDLPGASSCRARSRSSSRAAGSQPGASSCRARSRSSSRAAGSQPVLPSEAQSSRGPFSRWRRPQRRLCRQEAASLKASAMLACKEFEGGEWCHWQHFVVEADPASLWGCIQDICGTNVVSGVYIGVTQSLVWRWSHCQGHNSMMAHRDYYNAMFVLSIDRTAAILDLGSELIAHAPANPGELKALGCRCDNRMRGGTGPVRSAAALALYVVIRR